MVKLPAILSRLLKRSHPDVYEALKSYAEAKGSDVGDILAAAISAYLSADDEGKEELEKAMAERRSSGGGASNIKGAIALMKEMTGVYKEMAQTFADMRASFQTSQIIADYKALAEAARGITEVGQSKGSGSLEDLFARALVDRMLTGLGGAPRQTVLQTTGKGRVEKVTEEE